MANRPSGRRVAGDLAAAAAASVRSRQGGQFRATRCLCVVSCSPIQKSNLLDVSIGSVHSFEIDRDQEERADRGAKRRQTSQEIRSLTSYS